MDINYKYAWKIKNFFFLQIFYVRIVECWFLYFEILQDFKIKKCS